ncbi:MAG: ribonuclease catalytic domain-containing protein [Bacilli bacterium]|nr:ribonuclease catalytic domain-containing protein [Bacilli bacterium]
MMLFSGTKLGEGYEITVSIADVTHYVKPTHPLDDEARTAAPLSMLLTVSYRCFLSN